MISRFFIDRPIFAAVLSIVITLAGWISVYRLPLAQFPSISPPMVAVTCNYPGANANVVAEAIAAPIEQQVNGVENMMYMASQCTNDGTYNLAVTFKPGVDINMAQVLVQNRVSLAIPSLPDVIKQTGVSVLKKSPDILMGVAIRSPKGKYNQLYLSNFAVMQVKDELARLEGVGDVFLFGQRDYSMRIWLNPDQLAERNITAGDVSAAIQEQNQPVATGSVGQEPVQRGQQLQVPLSTLGRLKDVEQFEEIILKRGTDGRLVRLKDVARVELGAKNQDVSVTMDGKETVFLAIFQMPDANALDTHDRVMDKLAELKSVFPEGVEFDIGFTTVPYTRESIREVLKTLREAIILVAFVVLLFLQNWRSAIIPLIAVPVAIVGTFVAMALFGFSLNNLTLFGLVLAIGIVVDDAIVVVEAVEHHLENGLSPRDATIKAMEQVSGPVIAVGFVLGAVFLPCLFISGITGQFFKQFAVTVAVSTLISTFNSLTLSPALTAVLLRPQNKGAAPPLPRLAFPLLGGWLSWHFLEPVVAKLLHGMVSQGAGSWIAAIVTIAIGIGVGWALGGILNRILKILFRVFNQGFNWITRGYTRVVSGLLRVSVVSLLVYVGLLGATYGMFKSAPTGFIPSQDMGYLMVNVQLPDSAATERTDAVMKKMVEIAIETPGIKHVSGIVGQSFVLNAFGSNFGSMFVNLKDYEDRRDPKVSSDNIAAELRKQFAAHIPEANIAVFGPPPVRGAGRAGGFMIMLEDRGDAGSVELQKQTDNLVNRARQLDFPITSSANSPPPGAPRPKPLLGVFSVFRANVPQFYLEPEPRQCLARGVAVQDFIDTLQIYQGSLYVNDFNLFGRTWQVIIQADHRFRENPETISQYKVRNAKGSMVPIGSLATLKEVNGPMVLTRYNMYPSAGINGAAGPGVSSDQALHMMQKLADEELPKNMAYEWTDMSYLELLAGNTATVLFGFAVVMVFLVLAAQYESWSLPLAVILVVPMCLLSALIGVHFAKMDVNIFTRIGFVVLVGLASKNAILIVEFARQQRQAGVSRREATLAACKLRLRPIIMTSFAFILGVIPLVVSVGAGAEMRRTLGVAVFSGMLGVTLFGLALTPVFFSTIDWLGETRIFTSPAMQWIGRIGLHVVGLATLGPIWVGILVNREMKRRSKKSRPNKTTMIMVNGNGNHTNGNTEPYVVKERHTNGTEEVQVISQEVAVIDPARTNNNGRGQRPM